MRLAEKVGQLFVINAYGQSVTDRATLSPQLIVLVGVVSSA